MKWCLGMIMPVYGIRLHAYSYSTLPWQRNETEEASTVYPWQQNGTEEQVQETSPSSSLMYHIPRQKLSIKTLYVIQEHLSGTSSMQRVEGCLRISVNDMRCRVQVLRDDGQGPWHQQPFRRLTPSMKKSQEYCFEEYIQGTFVHLLLILHQNHHHHHHFRSQPCTFHLQSGWKRLLGPENEKN